MAPAAMAYTPQAVMGHVGKLSDADPDFRFMALNDLLQLLDGAKNDFLKHDFNTSARTVDAIIKTLDDQNGEVQNLAIKCLGPLVTKVPSAIIAPMIEKLSQLKLKNSVDTSVPLLALRGVIIALPRPLQGFPAGPNVLEGYEAISRVLIPRLTSGGPKAGNSKAQASEGLLHFGKDANSEGVDVLIEVIRCFGPLLRPDEVDAIQDIVIALLESEQCNSASRKRAVVAVAMLAVYMSDEHLRTAIDRFTGALSQPSLSPVTRRLYISILGSMARSIADRFGQRLPQVVPFVLNALSEEELQIHLEKLSDGDDDGTEFNEVREAALVTLEAFMASCPQQMRPYTDDIIASCLRYLKYDPNYAVDDDDEMDVDDEEDAGDLDEDDEFEEDDGFEDDDDDASWKVRRCAAKAMYTLIATRGSGDLLENGVLYGQTAPSLIKRIDEREDNVRLEVISTLALLVRKTGEGLQPIDSLADELESTNLTAAAPMSRKRRRQSSTGGAFVSSAAHLEITSPVKETIPSAGPRADLARLTPSIVKGTVKQLKSKSVPSKQAVINLLDDMVLVQRGGLSEYFADLIGLIIESLKPTSGGSTSSSLAAAGGTASATPSTLRISALKLVSDITRTHSSSLLQNHLPKIVDAVVSASKDRFYKISSEAIRTAEELIKALTPPRSKGSGARFNGELSSLFSSIMDRGSANDADAEVRQRALHALGALVSRTSSEEGAELFSAQDRQSALALMQERLKNETTRLAAVRTIDQVAAHAVNPNQFDKSWIQDVALELAGQLRKANRSLRGSSIMALKSLTLSPASKGQLEPSTIDNIVTELIPCIANSDSHLLAPALTILAILVAENADLIATDQVVAAICELLKSHYAGVVLDPLLELVYAIGQSKSGGGLMQGLLKDVSVQGEASVVGKVIGTLLVSSGDSVSIKVKDFMNEVQAAGKNNDEPRLCLALAVLGEAGMRLGAASPVTPEVFSAQFRAEPDKVSLAAATALGRAGSGNVSAFLPEILSTVSKEGNTQYLAIQSIKEMLQSVPAGSPDLKQHAPAIWDELLKASKNADNRVICAECVGRLVALEPKVFLQRLQALLKDKTPLIRGMAVQAVRYTLPESDEALDVMLRDILPTMLLTMLQDPDLEIRRLSLTTLNSAVHNKPEIILPHLGEIMPLVLSETKIKPELVREVQLGPFKHKVDDGLEVRKSAYETLYALMETAFRRINNIDFYDRVVAGLRDDNDIRQLCNLMVAKLAVIDPDETARRLDAIADAYRAVLSVKLKDNAVKQEVEKQDEANKSVIRVTLLLAEKMKTAPAAATAATTNTAATTGAGASGASATDGTAQTWASYLDWVNKEFERVIKGVRDGTEKQR